MERIGATDSKVQIRDGKTKVFHINMLKQYFEREHDDVVGFVTVVDAGEYVDSGLSLDDGQLSHNIETVDDVNINHDLSDVQQNELRRLIEFTDVFSSEPGL